MKRFIKDIEKNSLESHRDEFTEILRKKQNEIYRNNKRGEQYADVIEGLPAIEPSSMDISGDRVRIGRESDLSQENRKQVHDAMKSLMPWRKGPFEIFGTMLDCEWDSSIKWNRVAGSIYPLENKNVLDIGSSCGYYMFRMASQNPRVIVGIEPYLTFYFQYLFLEKYAALPGMYCLPLKLEELPETRGYFHTVFCMGILYHRRSPIDTLTRLHSTMRKKGELVLETLVIEGEEEMALFPEKRYAKMNNIYFLPTIKCLIFWLQRAGFDNIRCVDVSRTTSVEQRKTPWMETESLEDFLDPDDPDKTVEGYPAPTRAIITARAK